jgi:hypothetical protein
LVRVKQRVNSLSQGGVLPASFIEKGGSCGPVRDLNGLIEDASQ